MTAIKKSSRSTQKKKSAEPFDQIYLLQEKKGKKFCFDHQVASVFDNMAKRSIPGYHNITFQQLNFLKTQTTQPQTIYDLGTSTGNWIWHFLENFPDFNGKIFAVDSSKEMLNHAKQKFQRHKQKDKIQWLHQPLQELNFKRCDLVVLNFSLQFVSLKLRKNLITQIYKALRKNGLLFLSEKIKPKNSDFEQSFEKAYHQFKQNEGYSKEEIKQKKEALKNVLWPESIPTHLNRLKKAGFSAECWYQWFLFASFWAQK